MKKTTIRVFLALFLAASSLPAAGLFDAINPIRIFQRAPERFTPEFKRDAYVIPPYGLGGRPTIDLSYPLSRHDILVNNIQRVHPRFLATIETANQVSKILGGQVVSELYNLQWFRVVDSKGEPVMYHQLKIQRVVIPAGLLAWYFSIRPEGSDPNDNEAGYWDPSTDPETAFKAGKSIAEKYIRDSMMFAE